MARHIDLRIRDGRGYERQQDRVNRLSQVDDGCGQAVRHLVYSKFRHAAHVADNQPVAGVNGPSCEPGGEQKKSIGIILANIFHKFPFQGHKAVMPENGAPHENQ